MLPDPLHPAVVHLPVALAVLIPLIALLAALAIRSKFMPARVWVVVPLLAALLATASWVALETGEDQEERVEQVVAERFIESHEERAETFMTVSAVLLAVSFLGLLSGAAGEVGRAVAFGLSVAVLGFAITVGHSGGELVYRHGAGLAYIDTAPPGLEGARAALLAHRAESGDDDSD
ncbi:MAG: DUF2231 domain-containing protein [Myxococcota bacterium]